MITFSTYKRNSGTFFTLNLAAVFTPPAAKFIRATLARFFKDAPTLSHKAPSR